MEPVGGRRKCGLPAATHQNRAPGKCKDNDRYRRQRKGSYCFDPPRVELWDS
jgi:hypothetical protein